MEDIQDPLVAVMVDEIEDAVFAAYVKTARWACGMDDDDRRLFPASLGRMRADVRAFLADIATERPMAWLTVAARAEEVGHDFWLTRNGHGAGFWDGGWPEDGAWLSDQAHSYGEQDLTLTDDNRLEIA